MPAEPSRAPRSWAPSCCRTPRSRPRSRPPAPTKRRTLAEQVEICEVEAPPFKESKRGELYARKFRELGLQNVRIDKVGNVLGDRPGAAPRPHFVLAAHLDTVFPEGTNVKTTQEGTVIRGPGIGDDCRGLAVVLAVVRALKAGNVQTPGTITFVGNVGEEGLGDLRGVKFLFNEGLKGRSIASCRSTAPAWASRTSRWAACATA